MNSASSKQMRRRFRRLVSRTFIGGSRTTKFALRKIDALAKRQLALANDCAITTSVVIVKTHCSLHHLSVSRRRIGIKVQHDAPFVAHGNAYDGTTVRRAKGQSL